MNRSILILFKFNIFLLFLQSMFCWLLWGQSLIILITSLFSALLFIINSKKALKITKSNIIVIIIFIIIQLYINKDFNLNGLMLIFCRIVLFSIILLLNNKIKTEIFKYLTKYFAFLLAISIFFWIIFLMGFKLQKTTISFNNNQYLFDNYFFFLDNLRVFSNPIIPRFSSVFLEPGQLGMITSFFLCANKFELKRKSVLIIFIANILTFSLAAYLLLLISASVYISLYSKRPIRNFIMWSLLLIMSYTFFLNLNNGDNQINNLIIARIQYEDGNIVGNNRFSSDLESYYDNFIKSDNALWGIGNNNYDKLNWEKGNAGYKVYILQNGIIGTLLVSLLYITMAWFNKTKMAWILLTVYIFCFLQAAYPLWESILLIFITSMAIFKEKNNNVIQFKTTTYERT